MPHLADLKPGGKYVMFDLYRVGGTPAVLQALLDAGFLHGDCIDGDRARRWPRTWRTCRASTPSRRRWCCRSTSRCTTDGHIVILHGNLAPEGAVAKVAGLKQRTITGPAKVFDGEEACFAGDPGAADRGRATWW